MCHPNLKGYNSAFHLACSHRDSKMIELLIDFLDAEQINLPLKYSRLQPLDESSEEAKKRDMRRWRMEYPIIHHKDSIDATALHIICRRFRDYKLTELLLAKKADVNALYREEALRIRKQNSKTLRDKFGIESRNDLPDLCLLHTMVHSQNARMVELLLQRDADPNIEMSSLIERNGERVALHCAVKQGV